MDKPCALCEIRPRAQHDIVCAGCQQRLDRQSEELTDDEQRRLVSVGLMEYGGN